MVPLAAVVEEAPGVVVAGAVVVAGEAPRLLLLHADPAKSTTASADMPRSAVERRTVPPPIAGVCRAL